MKIIKIIGTCIIPISLCFILIIFGLLSCNESETVDPYFEYKITYVVFYPNYNDTIIDTIPYEYHREVYNGYEIITDDKYQETNNLYKGVAPCKIVSQEKIAK
jgi:hypothetical protein